MTYVLMLDDQEIGFWSDMDSAPAVGSEISSGVRTYRVLSVSQPDDQERVLIQVAIS